MAVRGSSAQFDDARLSGPPDPSAPFTRCRIHVALVPWRWDEAAHPLVRRMLSMPASAGRLRTVLRWRSKTCRNPAHQRVDRFVPAPWDKRDVNSASGEGRGPIRRTAEPRIVELRRRFADGHQSTDRHASPPDLDWRAPARACSMVETHCDGGVARHQLKAPLLTKIHCIWILVLFGLGLGGGAENAHLRVHSDKFRYILTHCGCIHARRRMWVKVGGGG